MTLLLTTLALLAPGTGGGDPAPGISLKDLLQSDAVDSMRVGGLLRAYAVIADSDLSAVAGEDVQGLRINDAQLWFSAEAMGYEVFVKLDSGEATAFPPIGGDGVQTTTLLRDAWVRKAIFDQVYVYVGQYKCPLVQSGNVGDGNLAMIDRTRIGQLFSGVGAFQPGVAVMGDFGMFHAKVAVQNGADNVTDGLGIVARGEVKLGAGAKMNEGALGQPEGLNATIGVGYFKDDSQDALGNDFGAGLALDAYATFNRISFEGEILAADEDLAVNALGNDPVVRNDATPYDATIGFLLNDNWEGFVRYEDLDNDVSATIATAGVNYYVNGHTIKWQVNVQSYDDDNISGTVIEGGLSIGQSGRY